MGRVRSSQVANTLPPSPSPWLAWKGPYSMLGFCKSLSALRGQSHMAFFLGAFSVWQETYFNFRDKMWISVFRDKKENSFLSVSYFETRTRICSLNLGLWDKNEKFCHSISGIQMRTRIYSFHLSCISFVDLFQSVFFEKRMCNWRRGRYNVWQRPNALLQGL